MERNESRKGSVLVAGIYLGDQPNHIKEIVSIFRSTRDWEVKQVWGSLGKIDDELTIKEVTVINSLQYQPKFPFLNAMLKTVEWERYDFIILSDDDIGLPQDYLDRFLERQSRFDLAVAQSAMTHNSLRSHTFMEKLEGIQVRKTRFVEIGPLVSFRRDAFALIFPFDESSPMGWGYDLVWPVLMEKAGLSMGIIDGIPVEHTLRNPCTHYNLEQAFSVRDEFLAAHDHLDLEEAFTILESFS